MGTALSASLQRGIRFFQIPLPPERCVLLTLDLLENRELMGLTMFRLYDNKPGRVPSLFRWECRHLAVDSTIRQPTHLPFGRGVSTSFAPHSNDGTYDDSLALTLLVFPLGRLLAEVASFGLSCLAYDIFHYLLAPQADSFESFT